MDLVNPLRAKTVRSLPAQEEPTKQTVQAVPMAKEEAKAPTNIDSPSFARMPTVNVKSEVPAAVMVPHSNLVKDNPELKKAMELLAKHGIETSAPKVNYIKHSYEIEEALHNEFHAMYPLLGFKHVKTAINDAIRAWCDENRKEYNRRKGS